MLLYKKQDHIIILRPKCSTIFLVYLVRYSVFAEHRTRCPDSFSTKYYLSTIAFVTFGYYGTKIIIQIWIKIRTQLYVLDFMRNMQLVCPIVHNQGLIKSFPIGVVILSSPLIRQISLLMLLLFWRSNETIQLLREKSAIRVISRRDDHNYSARCCDLIPSDFFLYGIVKNKVFANSPASIQELKDGIRKAIEDIGQSLCVLVIKNVMKRISTYSRGRGGNLANIFLH